MKLISIMKIAACLLLQTVILFSGNLCWAQQERIDSLKKILPALHHSARVDCLNALADTYLKSNIDTAKYYVGLAYAEAKKIYYIPGIAESLSYKGEIEEFSDNFSAEEKFSRDAIEWYGQTSNKKRLAETFANLGFAQYARSNFNEAINNYDTAYTYYKKNNNKKGMFWALFILGHIYAESGNYEKAFELDRKGLEMAQQSNDAEFKSYQRRHLGWLFIQMGDYNTALDYFNQAYSDGIFDSSYYILDYAELYTFRLQYDSAKYFYNLADTSDPRALRFYLASTGEFFLSQKQFDKALPNLLRSLQYNKQKNDRNQVMRLLMDISKAYLGVQNYKAALKYSREGLDMANQSGAKQFIRDGSEILYTVYDARHQTDSAYNFYRQYIKMKDSILNDQVKAKLVAYGPQQRVARLNKENEIQKIKLENQSLMKDILIGSIFILLLLAFIVFRNIILKRKNEAHQRLLVENELQIEKLESEKKQGAFQQQVTELEMQALRAQMNPHFIFNSLNSINKFILQNDKLQASEYLTKFSRLVRLILQNSQVPLITMESELEALKLYLELEALRFDNQFNCEIYVNDDVDTGILKVPPLIIQPYAENAIWHGLMHKEDKGHLEISLYQQDDHILCCKITDDGIGRKKARELNSKSAATHKSMGMRISADRIAILQQNKQLDTTINISDLVLPDGTAGGTEVLLKLPVMQ
ncbi:hypothetical protein BH20BAC1_BH20BAC1_07530 [soil metagenome]